METNIWLDSLSIRAKLLRLAMIQIYNFWNNSLMLETAYEERLICSKGLNKQSQCLLVLDLYEQIQHCECTWVQKQSV